MHFYTGAERVFKGVINYIIEIAFVGGQYALILILPRDICCNTNILFVISNVPIKTKEVFLFQQPVVPE